MSRPSHPVRAVAEMPGLAPRRFDLRAYCAPSYPRGFSGPEVRDAAMLISPYPVVSPATEAAGTDVLAIGSSCRICPRGECVARREASIISETL